MTLLPMINSPITPHRRWLCLGIIFLGLWWIAPAAAQTGKASNTEFGPVMRAYLGYLRNEQEVVDDRASRREINNVYYRRNSNRIRALRQMAIRIVRDSGNDYIPELEAVARDEMRNLFTKPPGIESLQLNGVINNTFRFLGVERAGEVFYLFARLDPYEQAELMQRTTVDHHGDSTPVGALPNANGTGSRPRRVVSP
ncbi:MAG: hypothetical protein ABJC05_00530 [Pyrinomonadaceae bacterium]